MSIQYNLFGWEIKKDFNQLTYLNEAIDTRYSYLMLYLKQIEGTHNDFFSPKVKILYNVSKD